MLIIPPKAGAKKWQTQPEQIASAEVWLVWKEGSNKPSQEPLHFLSDGGAENV
jgi:hypothetical protein